MNDPERPLTLWEWVQYLALGMLVVGTVYVVTWALWLTLSQR